MNQSRRSFFGLGAALVGLAAASKVKPALAVEVPAVAPVPSYQPIVGEIRQVFSHFETLPIHSNSWVDIGHTHKYSGHTHTFQNCAPQPLAVLKTVRWDGNAWMPL
jgi:hypothetical protein